MKENDCECDISDFKINFSNFQRLYLKFISPKENKNKSLEKITESYGKLQALIKDLKLKGENCYTQMNNCCQDHSNEIDEMSLNLTEINDTIEKVEKHYNLLVEEKHKLTINLIKNDDDANEKEKEKEENNFIILNEDNENENNNIINENENENINIIQINDSNAIIEDKTNEITNERKIMENDKKNIMRIKTILMEQKKKKDQKDLKEIVKMEKDLNEILNQIEVELNRNDEQIEHIENNVIDGFELVDKGQLELQIAANSAVKRRKLKYQVGLGALFCAMGTVVPGIGNIVGAAVGGLAGYGLHKIDKYRLRQVEKANK
jgi:t-SNARE complex subunit (syntaxin)